jgi:hypothetical protein
LLSFPQGTEMFQFPWFPPPVLCVQTGVTLHDECGVSPFGHLRVEAQSTAHRSFSQSLTSFIGSWRQGIHRWLFVAWNEQRTGVTPPCTPETSDRSSRCHSLRVPHGLEVRAADPRRGASGPTSVTPRPGRSDPSGVHGGGAPVRDARACSAVLKGRRAAGGHDGPGCGSGVDVESTLVPGAEVRPHEWGRLPQNGREDEVGRTSTARRTCPTTAELGSTDPPVHQLGVVRTGQDGCLPTVERCSLERR